jgi:hypothetical protein
MSQPFRVEPNLPVGNYVTYSIRSPIETHTRAATCAEVECDAYTNGWVTTIDVATDLGQRQDAFIRAYSDRSFTEERVGATLVRFTFPPGQRCFVSDTHRISLDRPEFYVRRGGDHRGNPTGERNYYPHADAWVNDFGEHQDRIKKVLG